jgi:hypothetical protein
MPVLDSGEALKRNIEKLYLKLSFNIHTQYEKIQK